MVARGELPTLAAAVAAGLQALVILAISNARLTTAEFAPLAQLWAIWAVAAASLNYGFQQWAAVRHAGTLTLISPAGRSIRRSLVLAGAVLGGVLLVARQTVFGSPVLWWPLFASLLPLGTALVGLNRGELARRGRTGGLAAVIATENTIRLVATVGLAAIDAPPEWYGAALLAGFIVAAFPLPSDDGHEPSDTRPLATAVIVGLISHALLFGGPIILALGGGSDGDVVALFLVLSAFRAPFVLLQGVIPQLAVRFARHPERVASTTRMILIVGLTSAFVMGALGALLGDVMIGAIFSIRGDVSAAEYGAVGGTALLSVALSIATVRLVASGVVAPLLVGWTSAVAGTGVALGFGLLDDLGTIAIWLLIAHVVVGIAVALLTRTRSDVSSGTPPARVGSVSRPDT